MGSGTRIVDMVTEGEMLPCTQTTHGESRLNEIQNRIDALGNDRRKIVQPLLPHLSHGAALPQLQLAGLYNRSRIVTSLGAYDVRGLI